MKVKKAFALFDIHVLVKKNPGISEMLHKRQALLVAIEGIYSHYHHGNEVINQAFLCSSLFINWHLSLPHTVPLGICTLWLMRLRTNFKLCSSVLIVVRTIHFGAVSVEIFFFS